MPLTRQLAEQALRALEKAQVRAEMYAVDNAIDALRAALAEPQPEQEPVAWMVYTLDGKSVCVTDNPADFTNEHKALPLYTAPTPRKPLTDEEIDRVTQQQWGEMRVAPLFGARLYARAIERAHGIGEGQ